MRKEEYLVQVNLLLALSSELAILRHSPEERDRNCEHDPRDDEAQHCSSPWL